MMNLLSIQSTCIKIAILTGDGVKLSGIAKNAQGNYVIRFTYLSKKQFKFIHNELLKTYSVYARDVSCETESDRYNDQTFEVFPLI